MTLFLFICLIDIYIVANTVYSFINVGGSQRLSLRKFVFLEERLCRVDAVRLATNFAVIVGLFICRHQLSTYTFTSFIFRDALPILFVSIQILSEIKNVQQETFSNTLPLAVLSSLDIWRTYVIINRYLENEARIMILICLFHLLIIAVYRGFRRDLAFYRDSIEVDVGIDTENLISEDESQVHTFKPSPEDSIGLFSRLLFTWLDDILREGYRRPLEEKDFFQVRKNDRINLLSNNFQLSFVKEKEKHFSSVEEYKQLSEEDKSSYTLLVIKALIKSGALSNYSLSVSLAFLLAFIRFVPPQLLREILLFMQDEDASTGYGILLIFLLSIFSMLETFCESQRVNESVKQYMRVRASLQTAIYQKSLLLTSSAKETKTMGKLLNLLTTDVHRIAMLLYRAQDSLSTVLSLLLATYFLYRELGYATFVAELILLITLPISSFISRRIEKAQVVLMKERDKRVKLTTQMLSTIKALKLYGWDQSFRNKVEQCRSVELGKLRRWIHWLILTDFVWPMNFILVTFATFGTYTMIQGKNLDAPITFTTLSLLNLLKFPLTEIPQLINSWIESIVSLRRVTSYLLSHEITQRSVNKSNLEMEDFAVKVKTQQAYWDDSCHHLALKDLNLEIKKGELYFLTGLTGSGKTALLHMILNELVVSSDDNTSSISITGSVAYASQVPWIQNSTLRENILFGKPYRKAWYEKVLFACALVDDLNQLPYRDLTEIGERGINLSGGQKARLSLARAVYAENDILLLESCFEAVDEHVGEHLWQHCFLDILKGKCTVVCVTHALKRLKEVDHIIFMSNGKVAGNGTYDELYNQQLEGFRRLITALSLSQTGTPTTNKPVTVSSSKQLEEITLKEGEGDGKELTGSEEKKTGSVSWNIYGAYLNAAGGKRTAIITCSLFAAQSISNFLNTRWLAYASDHFEQDTLEHSHDKKVSVTSERFLEVYSVFSFCEILFLLSSTISILYGGFRASRALHETILFRVIRSPMSFFDTTPSGRIINRFSKDINMVDEELPDTFKWFVSLIFDALSTLFSVAYVTPSFLISLPVIYSLYRSTQKYYIASQREMQRWSSVLKSPIYSYFQETLEGTSTIRAFGRQSDFETTNLAQVERLNRAYYLSKTLNRWMAVRVQLTGNLLRTVAGIFVVFSRGSLNAGLAGLALTFSFNITNILHMGVRSLAYLETELVSVERIVEYLDLPSEAKEFTSVLPMTNWPPKGRIQLQNLKARYRPGLPLVLKGVNLVVESGEKVGIVGRTGSGKSSLFLVLLRLMEASEGVALIDGINLRTLGTLELRQRIAVIPQDPMLFAGTVRFNLDPTGAFPESKLVEALKICQLHEHFLSLLGSAQQTKSINLADENYPELSLEISESGSNLSFGQCQLFCIARAVLRNCRVLLLDEATSGIDLATDRLIQSTIRNRFHEKTVLTIAHRIETILDGDKVAVMEDGSIAEYDTPGNLLQNPESRFSHLVHSMQGRDV